MSLANPGDDYNELIPEGNGKVNKILKKARLYVIFLLIGILLGAYLQYAYLNSIVYQVSTAPCSDCFRSKEILNKENACLYNLLDNPQSASSQCRQSQQITDPSSQENNVTQIPQQPSSASDSNTPTSVQSDLNEPKGF